MVGGRGDSYECVGCNFRFLRDHRADSAVHLHLHLCARENAVTARQLQGGLRGHILEERKNRRAVIPVRCCPVRHHGFLCSAVSIRSCFLQQTVARVTHPCDE